VELRLGADLLVEDLGRLEDGGAPSDQILSVGCGAWACAKQTRGREQQDGLGALRVSVWKCIGLVAATAHGEEHRDEGLDPDGEREGHPEALREEEVALRLHLPNEEDAAATAR
tara:strand:+ start:110 stop:451 length:342 start_codon:yes stop_codon:yes gene_type:complete